MRYARAYGDRAIHEYIKSLFPVDDGFWVVGIRSDHLYAVCVDSRGEVVSEIEDENVSCDRAVITPEGDIVVADVGLYFITLARFSPEGAVVWTSIFDLEFLPQVHAIIRTMEGGYALAGRSRHYRYANTQARMVRINLQGNLVYDHPFFGVNDWPDCVDLSRNTEGCIGLGGTVYPQSSNELYLICTNPEDLSVSPDLAPEFFPVLGSPFPNPFNSSTVIPYYVTHPGLVRLQIYDELGRLMATPWSGYRSPGSYTSLWNGSNAPPGTYYVKLEGEGSALLSPIILQK